MGGVHVSPFPDPGHFGWPVEQATDFALAQLDYVLQTLSTPADTAAFFVEPVLGEGGYVPANERFLAGLRERADAHGILLVIDEVQTGFGRTGKFWGGDHFDARPDILVTAKGLASGFPLSAIAAPAALMEKAWPGSQGGTYGANAVACAAALATLDVIQDEHLVENSAERGAQLQAGAATGRRQARADHRRPRARPDDRQRVPRRRRQAGPGHRGRGTAGGGATRPASADLRRLGSGRPVHPGPRGQLRRDRRGSQPSGPTQSRPSPADRHHQKTSNHLPAPRRTPGGERSAESYDLAGDSSTGGGRPSVPGISVPLSGQRVVSGTLISAIAPITQAAIM